MQLGVNKQLQPHEIKSYKHRIKNQTSKNRKRCVPHLLDRTTDTNWSKISSRNRYRDLRSLWKMKWFLLWDKFDLKRSQENACSFRLRSCRLDWISLVGEWIFGLIFGLRVKFFMTSTLKPNSFRDFNNVCKVSSKNSGAYARVGHWCLGCMIVYN